MRLLQAFFFRLLDAGFVGLVALHSGSAGMVRPARNPVTQQLVLQMTILPRAPPGGA